MKKFLSLMLAGLMSVSLFVVGAAAETVAEAGVGGETIVVGASGGATSFEDTDKGSDIHVKVNDVTHKYAVDITFKFDDLTLGDLTWNVDDMRYDVSTKMIDQDRTVEIYNRSDNPVYAYAEARDLDTKDNVKATVDTYSSAVSKLEIAKAEAGTTGSTDDAGKGHATKETITIKLTSDDWNTVADYYATKKVESPVDGKYSLTTVTVYISANK